MIMKTILWLILRDLRAFRAAHMTSPDDIILKQLGKETSKVWRDLLLPLNTLNYGLSKSIFNHA